jgi:hypothetical protein
MTTKQTPRTDEAVGAYGMVYPSFARQLETELNDALLAVEQSAQAQVNMQMDKEEAERQLTAALERCRELEELVNTWHSRSEAHRIANEFANVRIAELEKIKTCPYCGISLCSKCRMKILDPEQHALYCDGRIVE